MANLSITRTTRELNGREKVTLLHGQHKSVAEMVKNNGDCKISDIDYIAFFDEVESEQGEYYPAMIVTKSKERYIVTGSVVTNKLSDVADDLDNNFEGLTIDFAYERSNGGNNFLNIFFYFDE